MHVVCPESIVFRSILPCVSRSPSRRGRAGRLFQAPASILRPGRPHAATARSATDWAAMASSRMASRVSSVPAVSPVAQRARALRRRPGLQSITVDPRRPPQPRNPDRPRRPGAAATQPMVPEPPAARRCPNGTAGGLVGPILVRAWSIKLRGLAPAIDKVGGRCLPSTWSPGEVRCRCPPGDVVLVVVVGAVAVGTLAVVADLPRRQCRRRSSTVTDGDFCVVSSGGAGSAADWSGA